MNLHFPQNEVARAEEIEIACVPNQYLVPKDGTPISGLIQDHVVSGFLLTLPDTFLSKEDYQYLVLSAFALCSKKLRILPPAIMKPVRRWTGKQVISTVLINVLPKDCPLLNMKGAAKVSLQSWQVSGHEVPEFDLSESCVYIRSGELMCGVLDKAQYGANPYGLVHCVYELYGPRAACHLLSCFSRLFTTYLQQHGFTLGIEDVLVSEKADEVRRKIIMKLNRCGSSVVKEAFDLQTNDEETLRNALRSIHSKENSDNDVKHLDYCMKVNSVQMSCMLGQVELEGARVRPSVSGRTLPSFKKFDMSPRAGGFIAQRFLSGISPQEFFFHCIAGREGLIDTAVKTSRSGYLQRCLVKHLEALVVSYDLSVRDADGSIIQFQYGEDGFDIGKVQFLCSKSYPFLYENAEILRRSKLMQSTQVVSDKVSQRLFKKCIFVECV
ncbi:unnamed protein product [Soboliphyme baturini]|uniref:DNA-directed RNA polymerase I subunit RPA1 n=1 Tax=Soboliphyme baturini TaxID=241478 RepID=A0A183IYD0_9BILA|nr:unnamed protein product [Soboliphyme baturini]